MPWLAVVFDTPDEWAERYGDLLTTLGAVAISESAGVGDVVLEPAPGEMPRWATTSIEALFELDTGITDVAGALVAYARRNGGPIPHPDWRFVGDPDIAALCRARTPRRFGRRLWVVPTDYAGASGTDVCVRLDAGLAFGTGDHPTTKLCLEWLDEHPPTDKRLVDFGCGSGILGIAAALLGAVNVLAVDHDPQALTATRNNAAVNGVEGRIATISAESVATRQQAAYDVVIANILADPLIDLAPLFGRLLKKNGTLVLSGILETQWRAVCAAQRGVSFGEPRIADGWALLAGATS